ncbi:hypothetical protein GQ55_8G167400 [Panicum hallii var. hallii]|uniref:Uncharacterized protein n=1 Tax=Panicum hallii var. hallii TaxID=1504633 RepID=A0A2T7CND6_9POAL|nr:hypothetical protein GQ55_8G167400 [Panicum hallii var. hallii]
MVPVTTVTCRPRSAPPGPPSTAPSCSPPATAPALSEHSQTPINFGINRPQRRLLLCNQSGGAEGGGRTEVLCELGAFGVKVLLDQRSGNSSSATRRTRAVELRTILTRLGPTFLKIGQGLSTRPHLCQAEYLEELAELQVRDRDVYLVY